MNARTHFLLPIVALAVAGLVTLWALTYFVRAWAQEQVAAETQRKVVEAVSTQVDDARARQEQLLSEYRWIDAERGVVGLPIERAMDLVVQEQGGRP